MFCKRAQGNNDIVFFVQMLLPPVPLPTPTTQHHHSSHPATILLTTPTSNLDGYRTDPCLRTPRPPPPSSSPSPPPTNPPRRGLSGFIWRTCWADPNLDFLTQFPTCFVCKDSKSSKGKSKNGKTQQNEGQTGKKREGTR